MSKIPALVALAFALVSCKKEDTAPPQRSYDGKWFCTQTINKEYTLENGDTLFTRNDTLRHSVGMDYFDFRIDRSGVGTVLKYMNKELDSMAYEAITPKYFHLDTLLCEVNSLSDSAFAFNTLLYRYNVVPGRVQVTQVFFSLTK